MTDRLQLRRKGQDCFACEVRGRQLAPAMWQFDNLPAVADALERGGVPCEEWTTDPRSGLLNIPGGGCARVGEMIVVDDRRISVYGSLHEMLERYDVIKDTKTSRRRDGKKRIRTGKTA